MTGLTYIEQTTQLWCTQEFGLEMFFIAWISDPKITCSSKPKLNYALIVQISSQFILLI